MQPGEGHLCCFFDRILLGEVVVVVDDVVGGELGFGELGWCGCVCCCSGWCFDWMARMRVSMSVLKTAGFVLSELSDVLESLDGEAKPVVS